jgi:hypothetical protein
MINHIRPDTGTFTERRSDANPVDQQMSSGQVTNVEALRSVRQERIATPLAPTFTGVADARTLEAHAERRRKLAARVRLENPSRTEEEIEARLEQFGA